MSPDASAARREHHSDRAKKPTQNTTPSAENKGGFGFHPIGAWLDNTGEALAAVLRPGNAGSNTAADHVAVLDLALAQLPDAHRAKPILVRVDGAGFSHALIDHLATAGLQYSIGFPSTEAVRKAIGVIPAWVWCPAIDAVGGVRDGADVAEITDLLGLSGWPGGMRVIVRRKRPHPGAQLDAFEERDGYRYQAVATNTERGQLQFLEARHRAHARVEDRIRCGKDTGLGRFPSRHLAINAAWLELSLTAADLLAFTQTMLLDGDLARAEPKKLRYRLLHTAARITRGQRKVHLRLAKNWPWALALAQAFTRLRVIPLPT